MNYHIIEGSDCPILTFSLNRGETVKIERGAMAYLSGVELKGKVNSKGGLIGALGKSWVSGESTFITKATATKDGALLGVAPALPGQIAALEVGANQYCLNTNAFLACTESVSYGIKKQKLSHAIFSRTGGLFVMKTTGSGTIFVNAFGTLRMLEVTPDRPFRIDNEHVVAWDAKLDYQLRIASGTIGFVTGEGIVNEFHGSGLVIIQTRNFRNFSSAIMQYSDSKE